MLHNALHLLTLELKNLCFVQYNKDKSVAYRAATEAQKDYVLNTVEAKLKKMGVVYDVLDPVSNGLDLTQTPKIFLHETTAANGMKLYELKGSYWVRTVAHGAAYDQYQNGMPVKYHSEYTEMNLREYMNLKKDEPFPDGVLEQEQKFFGLPVYFHLTYQSAIKIAKLCKIYGFQAGDHDTKTFLARVQ